jgi:hypothetical protein
MIGNRQLRPWSRSLAFRRAVIAVAGLSGVVLATVAAGEAIASGRPHHAAPGSLSATIKHDEAFVSKKNHHCAGFAVHGSCPFQVATTSDRAGGHLIAINLRWFTMDACDRGVVYFFHGTKFIQTTRKLRPFSVGGVKNVFAAGAGKFTVNYWVSRSKFTSCAQNGNAGTDRYRYRWTGKHMAWLSGKPPRLPKVIVGTKADS